MSAEGDVLFCNGTLAAELMNAESASGLLLDDSNQTFFDNTEEEQILYKFKDIDSDYLFLCAIPKNSVSGTVESYTQKATAMLVITGLLVCFLLAITLYINYKPVVDLLSRHVDSKQQISGMSELELIDSHFFALDEKLNDQNRLLATFVLEIEKIKK